MNQVMIGLGNVYDVSSILVTFYDPVLKPVNFMAVQALPATCQFVIPYQLYNGNSRSLPVAIHTQGAHLTLQSVLSTLLTILNDY